MKETKKTNNIVIREPSRHSRAESSRLKPMTPLNQETKPASNSNYKKIPAPDLRKEFVEAQNLTEEEQIRIRREAQKAASKKMKSTEVRIENDLVTMLEQECCKLGGEVEKEKMENQRLKFEIGELHKKIDLLSGKLENIYKDNERLAQNRHYGQLENGQLNQELSHVKISLQKLQDQKEQQHRNLSREISSLKQLLESATLESRQLTSQVSSLTVQKEELEEEMASVKNECAYIRNTFEEKKREWDRRQQEVQGQARENINKKGQKITKIQVQVQTLTDKLKEEETTRKKIADKNQELIKENSKKMEMISDLEEQISNYKKRINDLSILKSSNNAIMNQKLQQLSDENIKLKKSLQMVQKRGVLLEQQASKPVLFGSEDF